MARVVGRLPAASPTSREVDVDVEVPQKAYGVGARVREELVSEAGGEEGHAHNQFPTGIVSGSTSKTASR